MASGCTGVESTTGYAKHWVFTINNYDEENEVIPDESEYEYMVIGKEIGEEGTPHLQGYVCFKNKKRFRAVKLLMPRAHLEVMRGTPEQASNYCKKDGEWASNGTCPKSQGSAGGKATKEKYQRTILHAKKREMDKIEDEAPDLYLRFYSTLKRIGKDNPAEVKDLDVLDNEWIYGEPDTGKSRTARRENPGFYDKSLNKWWEGYQGEEVVVIDDLDKETAKWMGNFLKRWADHYPFPAEEKFGAKVLRPRKIVVTSNYSIDELFGHDEQLCKALKRRFKVRHFVNALQ